MYKNNRPINMPLTKGELSKLPNQAHKLRHAKDRPVSATLCEQSAKVTSEDIAKAIIASNVQITYVPSQGHKAKNTAKAKQKAVKNSHYSTLVKSMSFKRKK